MPLIRHLFLLWSLVLLPAVSRAQTFPTLAPLPGTGTLGSPADPNNFTFVIAGDNRPAKSGDPQPATRPSRSFHPWRSCCSLRLDAAQRQG
jgi:hypothetical protein